MNERRRMELEQEYYDWLLRVGIEDRPANVIRYFSEQKGWLIDFDEPLPGASKSPTFEDVLEPQFIHSGSK